jgi:hypothetical protein
MFGDRFCVVTWRTVSGVALGFGVSGCCIYGVLMAGSMGVKGLIISSDLCLSIEGSPGRASGWVWKGVWMIGTQMYASSRAIL